MWYRPTFRCTVYPMKMSCAGSKVLYNFLRWVKWYWKSTCGQLETQQPNCYYSIQLTLNSKIFRVFWYMISVLSVCLDVCIVRRFESLDDVASSYLHMRNISREYRSFIYGHRVKIKVTGTEKRSKTTQSKTSIGDNCGSMKHKATQFLLHGIFG